MRIAGEIALIAPRSNRPNAGEFFERSLMVARAQQAKSWELRTVFRGVRHGRFEGSEGVAGGVGRQCLKTRELAGKCSRVAIVGKQVGLVRVDKPVAYLDIDEHRACGSGLRTRNADALLLQRHGAGARAFCACTPAPRLSRAIPFLGEITRGGGVSRQTRLRRADRRFGEYRGRRCPRSCPGGG